MLRPLKVATPLETVTVLVPDRIAPVVPVPKVMDRVTWVLLSLVTTKPLTSSTDTAGWGLRAEPPVAPPGWVVKASLLAIPEVTVTVALPVILAAEA